MRILHAEVDEVATIDNSEQLVKDAKEAGKTNIELVRQVNSAWSSDANLTQSHTNQETQRNLTTNNLIAGFFFSRYRFSAIPFLQLKTKLTYLYMYLNG